MLSVGRDGIPPIERCAEYHPAPRHLHVVQDQEKISEHLAAGDFVVKSAAISSLQLMQAGFH